MASKKIIHCRFCDSALPKDVIALNKKIRDIEVKDGIYRWLTCMAEYLECSEEELVDKIEEFKAEGCKLFS